MKKRRTRLTRKQINYNLKRTPKAKPKPHKQRNPCGVTFVMTEAPMSPRVRKHRRWLNNLSEEIESPIFDALLRWSEEIAAGTSHANGFIVPDPKEEDARIEMNALWDAPDNVPKPHNLRENAGAHEITGFWQDEDGVHCNVTINDPDLIGVDPFSTELSKEYQKKVFEECKINPNYFFNMCTRPEAISFADAVVIAGEHGKTKDKEEEDD